MRWTSALKTYRAEHGIDSKWETRERVVVALTGGPEGETLIRRGARIAARFAGGELHAVHVTSHDGLATVHPELLDAQRNLLESLGGEYHYVVGEDVPRTLAEFARSINATQLVLGVSRRSRIAAAFTGPGIGATVIRESGDIDVHIVTHNAAGGRLVLPRLGGALTRRRQIAGLALALIAGPLLTMLLLSLDGEDSITAEALSYQLLVVVVALVGGLWPALFAAVLAGLTLDFFFVEPERTVTVNKPAHVVALLLFVVIGALVSYVVDQAARRTRAAQRAAAESELLVTVAGSVLRGEGAVQALVSRTREAFALDAVRLVDDGDVIAADGPIPDGGVLGSGTAIEVGDGTQLELYGRTLEGSERRLLGVITAQLETAIEHSALAATAQQVAPLAQADRVRSALLSAVSHDLRRPLSAATAAVSGLRATDVSLADADRAELLATADESLATLTALVTSLLDVSRLEAGALAVTVQPTDAEDVILGALDELALGPSEVTLDLDPRLPAVLADRDLLARVVVNLLDNARRFSPPGVTVRVSTSAFADKAEIRVIDRGPGVDAERRDSIFVPFQRLGDNDNLTGLGLGLALARGFAEGMGGTLEAEGTPGGGLTMVVSMRAVGADGAKVEP